LPKAITARDKNGSLFARLLQVGAEFACFQRVLSNHCPALINLSFHFQPEIGFLELSGGFEQTAVRSFQLDVSFKPPL